MSTRAPATRAGASPAGDAPATIVTEPRFARPFRGAAAAASLGMDAGCQTEPLPQLEPLRPLRDRETDDAGKPPSDAARAEADERLGAGEEALARRRRRSSSVERDDAAREIERISAVDFERRVATRREALVETGVLEGGATRAGADGESRRTSACSERTKTSSPRARADARTDARTGVVFAPEPPSSGVPACANQGVTSPPVVRRKPSALDVGARKRREKTAREKRNSLSGDGDFIAFDTTLPVPPASPSERDGRARGPTPPRREALGAAHTTGADGATSAPASPDSPDWDECDRDPARGGFFVEPRSAGAAEPEPSRRSLRGIAIAGGARGRRSPGRRVVSPGANGTLHFGSAAPSGAPRARATQSASPRAGAAPAPPYDGDASPAAARFFRESASPRVSSATLARSIRRNRSDPAPRKPKPSVSSLSRGLGSLGSLGGAKGEGEADGARREPFLPAGTSAFAVVVKNAFAPSPEGIEPERAAAARGGVSRETPEDHRGGSCARKSVLTMSLRGERSP